MRYPGENATGRAPGRRPNSSGRAEPPEARPTAGGTGVTGGTGGAGGARGNGGTGGTGGTGGAAAGGKAGSDASLFAPGYTGGRALGGDQPRAGDGWSGPAGGAGKGPVRGFPAAPGQPPPLYPPGQFTAWNRAPSPGQNGYDPGLTGPPSGAWPAGYPDAAGSSQAGYAGYSDAGYAGYSDAGYAGYSDAGYSDAGSAYPGHAALAVSDPATDVTSTQSWPVAGDTAAGSDTGPQRADTGPQRADTGPQRADTGPQPADTGAFDMGTPPPSSRDTTGPSLPVTTEPGTAVTGRRPAPTPGRGRRGRGSRGRKRPRRRGKLRALLACGVALIVVAAATYFFVARDRKPPAPAADSQARTLAPPSADPTPSPSPLGQWGHIETRALDPRPLSLAELFPASFTSGTTSYVRTAAKSKTHCSAALVGGQLIAAASHARCTQAMRASYLSSDHKLMGTIGVLNLITATAAEQAGKAAGPSEFIAQLVAAHGPTRNLTKGTGFEAAEVKGHYLVLVWAEFANLRTPRTAQQRSELEQFITLLMQKTANVSLATRQVTGSPPA